MTALLWGTAATVTAQNTPTAQMEKLGRGVVAVPASGGGQMVGWRLLGTDDDERTTFDVLRDGTAIASGLATATCYVDPSGTAASRYQVVTRVDGVPTDTTAAVTPWTNRYTTLHLDRPTAAGCTYTPNDCSVGDVDGDGEYELFVKWDPSNAKDNSQKGKTGNVFLDCYRLDGTKLWRIDLGPNIRAGAHYTQYLVYDFDRDGKAELICKTAPGSVDGMGRFVSSAATDDRITGTDNTKDYRNSNGYVLSGPEFLSVFSGETGKALHTVFYRPNRAFGNSGNASYSSAWGDSYGNRGDRFLATVAYLDGPDARPAAVMGRGYYTQAYVWAVDFDGTTLTTKWLHGSTSNSKATLWNAEGKATTKTYTSNTSGKGNHYTLYGNGNHNLSVADVDGDGCDEIIYGSAALDHDGSLLYATGYGHGDAIHLGDLLPDRPGLEVFQVHEEKTAPYGWDLHDAATGQIIHSATGSSDNGRGMSADIDASNRGYEFWSSNDRSIRSATTGQVVSAKGASVNFRIYWDGDLQDELLDGTKLDKWNGNGTTRLVSFHDYGSSQSCNGTKSTPNLQADILGDWREEVILYNSANGSELNIFTTNEPTDYRVPTLMHDHVYRMGITWQNTAYNQPPHLGYYLPDRFAPKFVPQTAVGLDQTVTLGDSIRPVVLKLQNANLLLSKGDSTYLPDGSKVNRLDAQFSMAKNMTDKTLTLTGMPTEPGDYTIVVKGVGNVGEKQTLYQHITIHVAGQTDGVSTIGTAQPQPQIVYNMAGVRQQGTLDDLPKGVYLVKRGAQTVKVIKD